LLDFDFSELSFLRVLQRTVEFEQRLELEKFPTHLDDFLIGELDVFYTSFGDGSYWINWMSCSSLSSRHSTSTFSEQLCTLCGLLSNKTCNTVDICPLPNLQLRRSTCYYESTQFACYFKFCFLGLLLFNCLCILGLVVSIRDAKLSLAICSLLLPKLSSLLALNCFTCERYTISNSSPPSSVDQL